MLKATETQEEAVELRERGLDEEVISGSHEKTLGCNKYKIDNRKGFNEYN